MLMVICTAVEEKRRVWLVFGGVEHHFDRDGPVLAS
jgi:hypothetical protein